jgi:hypothetical protein
MLNHLIKLYAHPTNSKQKTPRAALFRVFADVAKLPFIIEIVAVALLAMEARS